VKFTVTIIRTCILALGLVAAVSPAAAQWTRVTDLPQSNVFSVRAKGDTLVAGANTLAYVSTDAGSSWRPPSQPGTSSIRAVVVRNGKLYVGTSGQGVFISDNLGQTWRAFNEGLVGGLFNSQLDVSDLQVRGDSLYAATLGAGVYVRNLAGAGTWSHFGEEFEANQASNVFVLALGGSRLLAGAGGNGSVFFRDPGAAGWTESLLGNIALRPGLQASAASWTGTGWVVGASGGRGVFKSLLGQEPWTFVDLNLGPLKFVALATRSHRLFSAFDIVVNGADEAVMEQSGDDGATWQSLDVLPNTFVFQLTTVGSDLYAARADGLWRRSIANVSVPGQGQDGGLRFALVGPRPAAHVVRLSFDLPQAGSASIDVFDVTGRRATAPIRQTWSAGTHEVSLDAGGLRPGVYEARLTAGSRHEVVRIVLIG
jgi:hypothetical protein